MKKMHAMIQKLSTSRKKRLMTELASDVCWVRVPRAVQRYATARITTMIAHPSGDRFLGVTVCRRHSLSAVLRMVLIS